MDKTKGRAAGWPERERARILVNRARAHIDACRSAAGETRPSSVERGGKDVRGVPEGNPVSGVSGAVYGMCETDWGSE